MDQNQTWAERAEDVQWFRRENISFAAGQRLLL